jgi:hypothetical protein
MRPSLLRTFFLESTSVVFIGAIALLARLTGFDLLMFPELGALASDIIKRPHGTWARAPVMLVLTPLLTAIIGMWITQHMAFGVVSVLLDVVLSMVLIEVIRSPIAPGISAALLPLVLEVHSWWYPLAISAGTAALAIISTLRRRWHPPRPVPSISDKVDNVMEKPAAKPLWLLPFLLLLAGLAFAAQRDGWRTLMFPPLVVTGFEMFAHPLVCPWARRPWRLPFACALSALVGVVAVNQLGAGVVAAALSMAAGLVIVRAIDLYAPPALAVGLLPMVLAHPNYRYVAAVLISTVTLTLGFRIWQEICLRWLRCQPELEPDVADADVTRR